MERHRPARPSPRVRRGPRGSPHRRGAHDPDRVARVKAGRRSQRREASVAEAARAMRDAGASAALITDEPPGIVTHRDLGERVVAAGLEPGTPGARGDEPSAPAVPRQHAGLRGAAQDAGARRPPPAGHPPGAGRGHPQRHRSSAPSAQEPAAPPQPHRDPPAELSDVPGDYSREVASIAETLFYGGLGRGPDRRRARRRQRCAGAAAARSRRARARPAPLPVLVDRARLGGAPGAGAAQRPGQRARLPGGGAGRGRATSAPSPSWRSTG